jgi:putative heme-binding domain-containing protein
MAKLGRGRMPHIGSQLVDEAGLDLVYEWIEGLSGGPSGESGGGSQDDAATSAADAHVGAPALRDKHQAQALVQHYLAASSEDAAAASLLGGVFTSTRAAVLLERAVSQGRPSPQVREKIVQAAAGHADPIIRELFERFLPDEQRVKRLGTSVTPGAILAMTGDADRGRRLYAETAGMLCRNCHRVGETGLAVGPDLTAIARQRTRAELLESILDPSRKIDPKWIAYVVETKAGQVHTGLLVERTPDRVTLRPADNKTIDVPAAEIEQLVPQQRSLMPDLLYRDLTADQLADLLAYLESLK